MIIKCNTVITQHLGVVVNLPEQLCPIELLQVVSLQAQLLNATPNPFSVELKCQGLIKMRIASYSFFGMKANFCKLTVS